MPLRDFLVSPGIVGVAAVVAALIVLCAVLYAIRRAGKRHDRELEQRDRHHREAREAEQHAKSSAQCWQTFTWLVETAGVEPAANEGATLGLGPEPPHRPQAGRLHVRGRRVELGCRARLRGGHKCGV